jgi:hypothetical protein
MLLLERTGLAVLLVHHQFEATGGQGAGFPEQGRADATALVVRQDVEAVDIAARDGEEPQELRAGDRDPDAMLRLDMRLGEGLIVGERVGLFGWQLEVGDARGGVREVHDRVDLIVGHEPHQRCCRPD